MTVDRLYSIQEASRLLDLKPATLRAWERRFGVPQPRRASNGYRLYTRADLEVLHRIKADTDGGVRLGLAIKGLSSSSTAAPLDLNSLLVQLTDAVFRLDDRRASTTLREALALHPMESFLTSLVEPLLNGIGDEWQAGRVSIGVEHFASALFVRHLVALYLAAPEPWRPGRTIAASVPGDRHEIGLLALSTGLRRRGWDVRYLGADLPFGELERAASALKPVAILLSATHAMEDGMLVAIGNMPRRLSPPVPEIVLGGRAFRGERRELDGATILDAGLAEAHAGLETSLLRRSHASSSR